MREVMPSLVKTLRRCHSTVSALMEQFGGDLRVSALFWAAATHVLTRALALELRERDITVNAVSLDVDKPCAPDRVADVVAYLLTDRGHRLTGHVLRVDGPGHAS